MTAWVIFFVAISLTITAKWYFSNAIARLRQNLSRQQRETLELKGTLTDARDAHRDVLRQAKTKEVDITRIKKRIFEQKTTIRLKIEQKERENTKDA